MEIKLVGFLVVVGFFFERAAKIFLFSVSCTSLIVDLLIQQKKRTALILKINKGKIGLEQTKVNLIFSFTKGEHFILQHYAVHQCKT